MRRDFLVMAAWLLFAGCGSGPAAGPLGATGSAPLLVPLAGEWTCDAERTLAARKEAGVSALELDALRTAIANSATPVRLHEDLHLAGDVAVGQSAAGRPDSEYHFFLLHRHGETVCGKAWHHEDREDPGDMSKCHVRLTKIGDELHFQIRMQEGLPDSTDPDLVRMPPTLDDPARCDVGSPAGADWSPWEFFVFRRKT